MILLIVFGSIIAYIVTGLVVNLPMLPSLYESIWNDSQAINQMRRRGSYVDYDNWSHLADKEERERRRQVAVERKERDRLEREALAHRATLRMVTGWYAPLAFLWPLTMWWGVARIIVNRTPQNKLHEAERRRREAERELADALKILAHAGIKPVDFDG